MCYTYFRYYERSAFYSRGVLLIKLKRASSDHRRDKGKQELQREKSLEDSSLKVERYQWSVWGGRVCEDGRDSGSCLLRTHNQSLSSSRIKRVFCCAVRIKLRCGSHAANLIPLVIALCVLREESTPLFSVCQPLSPPSYPLWRESYLHPTTVRCGWTINTRIFAHQADHFLRSSL